VAGKDEGSEIEQVRAWAAGLEALHARIAGRFVRAEPRRRALAYLKGLLGDTARKNGWQLAEQAGEATPDGMQRLLNQARWDPDEVRDDLRGYVVEHLGDERAVLVVDETGFLKKGTKSAGVQRQYSGTAGRIENCQVGVFLTYASPAGRAFIDRELYLPTSWTGDRERCGEAGVAEGVGFATKPELARRMLESALDAGVPARWVTGDAVYGGNPGLRDWLEQRGMPYVLAVKCTEPMVAAGADGPVATTAAELAARVPAFRWLRCSCGEGAKGPRWYDWTQVALAEPVPAGQVCWLLVRRSIADPTELAFYRCVGPTGTPLIGLVRVAGARWAVEEGFEQGKGEVGLDHYEVRRWDAWYRHVTLAMLAHAFLAVTRSTVATSSAAKGGAAGSVADLTCSR